MVGKAKGRSITASTNRLPGKSSRVRTQATSNPKTRLITVTPIETVSVTRKDSTAALDVTAAQNAAQPPPAACHRIAASGSRTMTDNHNVAAPTRSPVVPNALPTLRPGPPEAPSPVTSGRTASGLGSTTAV